MNMKSSTKKRRTFQRRIINAHYAIKLSEQKLVLKDMKNCTVRSVRSVHLKEQVSETTMECIISQLVPRIQRIISTFVKDVRKAMMEFKT